YVLPKAEFIEKASRDADFSYYVLKCLAEQFQVYADRLDNLEYKSAYEKVVYRLLFLAARFGQAGPDGVIIKAPITHELIAESVNLARESVSRQIEKLEKKGLIIYRQGQIIIKDVTAVSQEFSEPITLDLWGLK
ncbi:MAG TPA: Crp/Fnr family transcriptional regulator, partial [Candidatus Saccharimonadales bacterium]|nr:Crp/Fnr family transcriptional regulator [Candidatus Saccharimonadales bacterium]